MQKTINKLLDISLVFFLILGWSFNSFAQIQENAGVESDSQRSENKILAIRKIIFSFEDYNEKTKTTFINHKKIVEIEMVGKYPITVLNCCEPYAIIDGKSFYFYRGSQGRYFIEMDEKIFKDLRDESKICVRMLYMAVNPNPKAFAYSNPCQEQDYPNKTKRVLRLEKKLIKKSQTLREDRIIQYKRRYKSD